MIDLARQIRVQLDNNSDLVKAVLEQIAFRWLEEASGELESETIKRSRRASGDTASKWQHIVDKNNFTAYIGNPLENAIWEEYGTGEYAFNGDGRKGGWVYYDEKTGKYYHTYGKKPNRMLHNSYQVKQGQLQYAYKQMLRDWR